MKEERFLNCCCSDNLQDVADTTGLKVTVHRTISSAVKLTRRPVSSKRSESKTRSVVGAIRTAALSTLDSSFKSRFLLFSCIFYFMRVHKDIV